MWPLRLVVRTLPSQGSNTGSSPVGVITSRTLDPAGEIFKLNQSS